MSYARPTASAADATWLGSAAYTRPTAGAADATWLASVSAAYNRPTAGAADATWLGSTAYTRPLASAADASFLVSSAVASDSASGFTSTAFGTPRNSPNAVGFSRSAFGTAAAAQFYPAVSLGPVSIFGDVFFSVNLILDAQGFSTTGNGFSIAITSSPPNLNNLCQTLGSSSTQLGTPNAGWLQTSVANGFNSTVFGDLNVVQTQQADGFTSTQYGTPNTGLFQSAVGFQSAAVGTPLATLTLQAVSVLPKTRFGLSTVSRSNTFTAYGIDVANQFGQPRSFNQFNYPASGFVSGASGSPTCFRRYLAAPTSPGSRFGKPLLRRNTQC